MRVRARARRAGIAALLLLAACGLGDRAQLEELITAAPARADGVVLTGALTVESRLVSVPAGAGPPGANPLGVAAPGAPTEPPPGGISLGSSTTGFSLDLATSRATLTAGAGSPDIVVVFDDLTFYGRRGGVPADDARPWVLFDLGDVDESAGVLDPFERGLDARFALHPAVVVDLVGGTLTGSIERAPEPEDGLTRYDVNISLNKAFGDTRRDRYPEDRREQVDDLLRLLGVVGDLHPAQVWLDGDGRLRRFRVELHQSPFTRVELALVVTLEIDATTSAAPLAIAPPPLDEVLGVDSVVRFVSTVAADGATDDASAGPSGPSAPEAPAP